MSDDFLKQFSSALADEHDGATAFPEATRGRVIRALAEKRRRSRKWWIIGVPALAIFGGSSAWAAATGHLPKMIDQAVAVFAFHKSEGEAPVGPTPHRPAHLSSPPALHESAPDELPSAPVAAAPPESPAVAAPTSLAQLAAAPPRDLVGGKLQTDQEPPPELLASALSTYQAAHRAQFQAADCPTAILGYQKYLNEDPAGSFAIEAKYNRGVCLAKMGRVAEAIGALQPFADGQFGAYRKDQSQSLIEALRKAP